MDFYHWLMREKQLSKASASKYDLVIKNRISEWMPSYEIPKSTIEFEALKQLIFSLDIYKERNRIGNNMYSSVLNHYGNYLREDLKDDVVLFQQDQTLTAEADKMVKVRLLQNKFRKALFDLNPICAVTGFSKSQFLVASHIKPWSRSNDQEKLDPYNGFLLTPNFDCLFDKGFITFLDSGYVEVSKYLDQEERVYFKIPHTLKIELKPFHGKYLSYHRDEIFKA